MWSKYLIAHLIMNWRTGRGEGNLYYYIFFFLQETYKPRRWTVWLLLSEGKSSVFLNVSSVIYCCVLWSQGVFPSATVSTILFRKIGHEKLSLRGVFGNVPLINLHSISTEIPSLILQNLALSIYILLVITLSAFSTVYPLNIFGVEWKLCFHEKL